MFQIMSLFRLTELVDEVLEPEPLQTLSVYQRSTFTVDAQHTRNSLVSTGWWRWIRQIITCIHGFKMEPIVDKMATSKRFLSWRNHIFPVISTAIFALERFFHIEAEPKSQSKVYFESLLVSDLINVNKTCEPTPVCLKNNNQIMYSPLFLNWVNRLFIQLGSNFKGDSHVQTIASRIVLRPAKG